MWHEQKANDVLCSFPAFINRGWCVRRRHAKIPSTQNISRLGCMAWCRSVGFKMRHATTTFFTLRHRERSGSEGEVFSYAHARNSLRWSHTNFFSFLVSVILLFIPSGCMQNFNIHGRKMLKALCEKFYYLTGKIYQEFLV